MQRTIFLVVTPAPTYNNDVKSEIHVVALANSPNNILQYLNNTLIKSINSKQSMPFTLLRSASLHVGYSIPFEISLSDETLYILEATFTNEYQSYTSIVSATSESYIIDIASEWFDDEVENYTEEKYETLLKNLDKFGRYTFNCNTDSKVCSFLIYSFDLKTEIKE